MTSQKKSDDRLKQAEIVARATKGCSKAEAEICRRYEKPMRAVIRRYTDNPADIDDWVNTSWLIALGKIREGEVRVPEALVAFLCGIARKVASREARKRYRQDIPASPEDLDAKCSRENTERTAEARELIELTEASVADLTVERDQQLLRRCFFEGHPQEQISADLNLDSVQFAKVLYRARQRLWRVAGQDQFAPGLRELFARAD